MSVSFTKGKYQDDVLCDETPMQDGYLLLCRPWQYDRRVTFRNRFTFVKDGKKHKFCTPYPKGSFWGSIGDEKIRKRKGKREWGKRKEWKDKEKGRKKWECLFSNLSFLQGYHDEKH